MPLEAAIKFGVLGPLELAGADGAIALRSAKLRVLLAVLLCRANQPVSMDVLGECLWPGERPPSAAGNLRSYVHMLRRVLAAASPGGHSAAPGTSRTPMSLQRPAGPGGHSLAPGASPRGTWPWNPPMACGPVPRSRGLGPADRLVHGPAGYQLTVRDGELDAAQFRELAARGERALAGGEPGQAGPLLHQAMALWRGAAYAGLPEVPLLRDEALALEEHRLHVLEQRISADLAAGQHACLIAELRGHVTAHPLRERFHAQLMLALYRAGRQGDALQSYCDFRERLVAELGIEPGTELRQLQRAILRADPAICDPAASGRDRPAAPPVPLRRPQAQLPAGAACFTGRAGHLRRLDELAVGRRAGRGPALALITATAGVGKTAIAVHWAHQAAGQFGDGQLYVRLRGHAAGPPVRPEDALAQLLRALGADPRQVPADADAAAAEFRGLAAGKRLLIVLDDAQSADQVRPLLPGSPSCMVIVTSRNRLTGLVATDGASRLAVAPLPLREASRLVKRMVDTPGAAPDLAAVTELARLCGGLPLALRIAAANLSSGQNRSVASYVRRLATADRVAELRADADDQASLSAAFDLSYLALGDAERRVFRLLGIAPGPDISAAAAASLAGLAPGTEAAVLDRLAAAHLIEEYAPGRFQLHDLLRLYAAQRATAEEPGPELRNSMEALAVWYLHRAAAAAALLYPHLLRLPAPGAPGPVAFADGAAALAWLEAERANLVAVIMHTAEHGPVPVASLLADALRGFFSAGRHLTDWLAAGRAVLRATEAGADPTERAAIRLSLGHALWCLGRYADARDQYCAALALAGAAGWTAAQATILGNLGLIEREIGEPATAASYLRLAVALDRQAGRADGLANNLANLGCVLTQLGSLDQALAACQESLLLFRRSGARLGEAHALANLGGVLRELGEPGPAAQHLQAALAIYQEAGDKANEADTLNALAGVHRDAGRSAAALELATRARKLAAQIGDRRAQADSLITATSVHQQNSQYQQAIRQDRKALRLARHTGTRYQQTRAGGGLALARESLAGGRQVPAGSGLEPLPGA